MKVKEEKSGKWYCRFYLADGRDIHRLLRGATNIKQAKTLANQLQFDLEMEVRGQKPKELKNVYIKRLVELYTIHAKNNHKNFRSQPYYLRSLEKYFGNSKPANKIKPEDIEKYKTYLKETKQLKNSSINRYLEILSKMFNLAIANGELKENPVKGATLKEDNHRIRFLEEDEERRMFESIDVVAPYLRPIVIVALQTGMRRGEIFGMKWCNVDFNNRLIHVLNTKTGNSREIPISEKLYGLLISLPKESEYVFTNPKTNKPYVDIKKSWEKVMEDSNIKSFRFHDLRHTFATRMVMAGVDFLTLMELLGHTNITTTMRYSHVMAGRKMEAIEKLAAYCNWYTVTVGN